MAVKLRFTRMGRRHRPFFRLNAVESRNPRDGKVIEKLGHYDPIEKDPEKQVVINAERIQYWLSVGAVPSETVSDMLAKHGIKSKHYEQRLARRKKACQLAHAKGKTFDLTERKQAEAKTKAQEEAKAKAQAETEAKAKAETEAKAKAQAETEAKAKAEAEAKAKAEEEAKAKAKAETETAEAVDSSDKDQKASE